MSPVTLALRHEFPVERAHNKTPQQQADVIQLIVSPQPTEQEQIWHKQANAAADQLGYNSKDKALVRSQFIAQFMMLKAATPGEERAEYHREQRDITAHYCDTHKKQARAQERGGIDSIFASYQNLLYVPK